MHTPKKKNVKMMISSLIDNYYSDRKEKLFLIKIEDGQQELNIFKNFITEDVKIICTMRDPDEILASFINMIKRNPYQEGQPKINFVDEQLVKNNMPINDM
jgi:hypothetical protein